MTGKDRANRPPRVDAIKSGESLLAAALLWANEATMGEVSASATEKLNNVGESLTERLPHTLPKSPAARRRLVREWQFGGSQQLSPQETDVVMYLAEHGIGWPGQGETGATWRNIQLPKEEELKYLELAKKTENSGRKVQERDKLKGTGGRPLAVDLSIETLSGARGITLETVRARCRLAEMECGLSQTEIAARMGYHAAGSHTVVSRLTNLKRRNDPKLSTLIAFAAAVGKPLNFFFETH